jgi:hypothetical protein
LSHNFSEIDPVSHHGHKAHLVVGGNLLLAIVPVLDKNIFLNFLQVFCVFMLKKYHHIAVSKLLNIFYYQELFLPG